MNANMKAARQRLRRKARGLAGRGKASKRRNNAARRRKRKASRQANARHRPVTGCPGFEPQPEEPQS